MTEHDGAIAAYQAELLRILHDGTDGAAMAEQIAVICERDLGVTDYAIDATLVEVAADLTRTWGRLRADT